MTHWRARQHAEHQTVPAASGGGFRQPPARHGVNTHAEPIQLGAPFPTVSVSRSRDLGPRNDRASLYPLPSRSIATVSAPLEPFNLSETVKDIAALAFTFLFLGSVGIGFAASMFLLFFCDLR